MNDPAGTVEHLAARMEALQQRVASLEQRLAALEHPSSAPAPLPAAATSAPPHPTDSSSLPSPTGVISILGQAMLAVAGAYLLRALAQSSLFPHIPVVVLAIAYAFLCIVPAARSKAETRFGHIAFAAIIWSATSALILLPMLWELTLHFRILTAPLAAAILTLYVLFSAALAWRRHFAEVAWIVAPSSAVAALALALATRNLPPFLAALLLLAAAAEFAATRHRALRIRPLIALAADLTLFALIWIYSTPASARSAWPHIPAALLLLVAPLFLAVYAIGASIRTILLRRGIALFDVAQTLIAFLLVLWGFLALRSGTASVILGALCLAASIAGYAAAFARFGRALRNYHVYATGSLILFLAGSFLSLASPWLALCLCAFAAAAAFAGLRTRRLSLQFHSFAALAAAALVSGLLLWSARSLALGIPSAPGWIPAAVAAFTLLCYLAIAQSPAALWPHRALALASAALLVFSASAFLVWGLVHILAPHLALAPRHVTLIRTLTGCAVALLLARTGSRPAAASGQHPELVWLAWTTLALLAVKLLLQDLPHGHLALSAVSISVFAVTLLLVPRLVRHTPGAR